MLHRCSSRRRAPRWPPTRSRTTSKPSCRSARAAALPRGRRAPRVARSFGRGESEEEAAAAFAGRRRFADLGQHADGYGVDRPVFQRDRAGWRRACPRASSRWRAPRRRPPSSRRLPTTCAACVGFTVGKAANKRGCEMRWCISLVCANRGRPPSSLLCPRREEARARSGLAVGGEAARGGPRRAPGPPPAPPPLRPPRQRRRRRRRPTSPAPSARRAPGARAPRRSLTSTRPRVERRTAPARRAAAECRTARHACRRSADENYSKDEEALNSFLKLRDVFSGSVLRAHAADGDDV